MPATPTKTGLQCPSCKQPVGVIENRLPHRVLFWCPACNHRWSTDEPITPKR